jgi:uncharacterized protein YcbX
MLQLSQIIIYPIKGLPGIHLQECRIEARGFKYDRRFMLVDEEGLFISQRSFPKLTQCKISMQGQGFFLSEPNAVAGIFLPAECDGITTQVKVWDDVCEAVVCAQPINDWFSHFLGITCKLVYMHNESQRFLDATYNPGNSLVSFADGFPFLLLGQSSLDDINARLSIPVSMDRFRPNLVFTGGTAFEEDGFFEFSIGSLPFVAAKPCARCAVPNINQETGAIEKEPNHMLSTFRKFNNKILVGQNVYGKAHEGTLKIGDRIEVISKKNP